MNWITTKFTKEILNRCYGYCQSEIDLDELIGLLGEALDS